MDLRPEKLDAPLARLEAMLAALAPGFAAPARAAVERWRADAAAMRFHLRGVTRAGRRDDFPLLLAVVGGTGTGKSTLVNRLLGVASDVSASSFRRTFTAGPVAVARSADAIPDGWMSLEKAVAAPNELPARGRIGALVVVPVTGNEVTDAVTLVDTPDLDGDQPVHHAQADRAFRWAQAVLFLVTPEKYQMTELPPYYRLARRYGLPALFVMNKCEETAVLEDYAGLLAKVGATLVSPSPAGGEGAGYAVTGAGSLAVSQPDARVTRGAADRGSAGASPSHQGAPDVSGVFAIPRDDAAWQPPAGADLTALRGAIITLPQTAPSDPAAREQGLRNRAADLLGRLTDQVLSPLRHDRQEADRLIASVRAMESAGAAGPGALAGGVDVNPLTLQLQRRLQQRSVLYLMGPGRILDRVRQAPGLLVRLPRMAWDYLRRGEASSASLDPSSADGDNGQAPDFRSLLADQFAILHSRIDDALRSTPSGERWLGQDERGYHSSRIDVAEAGKIAEEELAELRTWLERHWNATPRDTRALQSVLKYVPGGKKLAQWSEAAPYLLTVVLVTHGAIFGPVDLVVLGGYGLATWLTEKLSNEVAARARATNARIAERFEALAHDQIERTCAWLDRQAPPATVLDDLQRVADQAGEALGE